MTYLSLYLVISRHLKSHNFHHDLYDALMFFCCHLVSLTHVEAKFVSSVFKAIKTKGPMLVFSLPDTQKILYFQTFVASDFSVVIKSAEMNPPKYVPALKIELAVVW